MQRALERYQVNCSHVPEVLAMVPDLSGQSMVLTGGTDGIGRALALMLASKGARLILCARSLTKALKLIDELRDIDSTIEHQYLPLDLTSIQSCYEAADWIKRQRITVTRIFANAGIAAGSEALMPDGCPQTFFVNHVAHQALCVGLMSSLCQDRDARVVVQSSLAHHRASCPSNYHSYFSGRRSLSTVYADSKLANILMAKGLQHHASKLSISMRALVVHPGYLVTNINQDMVDQSYAQILKNSVVGQLLPLLLRLGKDIGWVQPSAFSAALPALHAAFAQCPFAFTGPQGFMELYGLPGLAKLSQQAQNVDHATSLWGATQRYLQAISTGLDKDTATACTDGL